MNIDTRTAEEKFADSVLATRVAEQTEGYQARRKDLESDLATCKSFQVAKWLRQQIAKCDRALMELGSNRLPEFDHEGMRN